MRITDIHAHYFPGGLPDYAERLNDARWPTLMLDGGESRIMVSGRLYRVIDDTYYSLASRVELMDDLGIDRQILSPLPIMLSYWSEAGDGLEYCRVANELLSQGCSEHPGRFEGLGTVPLQAPALAIRELERIKSLGLSGVEIGTWLGEGVQLTDEPVLEFFHAAADLNLPLLLHPNAPRAFASAAPSGVEAGVGVPSETARAAALLHLSGVLHDAPGLRLCLSHGGGAFLWLWPRFQKLVLRAGGRGELADGLYADTAGLSSGNLAYVMELLGNDRILFGTDLPAAGRSWALSALAAARSNDAAAPLCADNAEAFLRG